MVRPTWLELAVLHEAAHAWMVLTVAGKPCRLQVPLPGMGEDVRCEWDAEDVDMVTAVCVVLAGLAAELSTDVPEELAWSNAEEDLVTLEELGQTPVLERLLERVQRLLEGDEIFARFYHWVRAQVREDLLPITLDLSPAEWQE